MHGRVPTLHTQRAESRRSTGQGLSRLQAALYRFLARTEKRAQTALVLALTEIRSQTALIVQRHGRRSCLFASDAKCNRRRAGKLITALPSHDTHAARMTTGRF